MEDSFLEVVRDSTGGRMLAIRPMRREPGRFEELEGHWAGIAGGPGERMTSTMLRRVSLSSETCVAASIRTEHNDNMRFATIPTKLRAAMAIYLIPSDLMTIIWHSTTGCVTRPSIGTEFFAAFYMVSQDAYRHDLDTLPGATHLFTAVFDLFFALRPCGSQPVCAHRL